MKGPHGRHRAGDTTSEVESPAITEVRTCEQRAPCHAKLTEVVLDHVGRACLPARPIRLPAAG